MPGKRPEPLEKRIGKGNPQKRPLPASPPARVHTAPTMPAWFGELHRECWERTTNLLFARGQLSADSEVSLIALCQCYAEWVELAQDIAANGRYQRVRTVAGERGKDEGETSLMERPRPAVAAFQDADRRLKGWLIEFGLTDASRGKVTGAPEGEGAADDPLARYGLN